MEYLALFATALNVDFFVLHGNFVVGILFILFGLTTKKLPFFCRLALIGLSVSIFYSMTLDELSAPAELLARYLLFQRVLLLVFGAWLALKVSTENFQRQLEFVAVTNAMLSIWTNFTRADGLALGWYANESFAAGLTACLLPFVRWYLIPPLLFAIYLQTGATGYVVLVVVFLAGLVRLFQDLEIRFFWGIPALLVGAALLTWVGVEMPGVYFFQDRLEIATMAFRLWINGHFWLGSGLATYPVYGIPEQTTYGIQQKLLFSAVHNDWVQLFFENGLIGGVLLVAAYVMAIWDSWNVNPRIAISLLAFAVFSLVYFPMQVAATFIVMVGLVIHGSRRTHG